MKVFAIWDGDYSYALGEIPEHLEVFPSLKSAMCAYEDRDNGGWSKNPFHYADGREEWFSTPTTEGSEMRIYFSDPRECLGDPYPDRIIRRGPRNGVRVEVC